MTLESAKCNFCHSLQTIKMRSAKGVELPPPSHFRLDTIPKLTPRSQRSRRRCLHRRRRRPPRRSRRPPRRVEAGYGDCGDADTADANTKADPAKNDTTPPVETTSLRRPKLRRLRRRFASPTPRPRTRRRAFGAVKPAPTGVILMGETSRNPFGDQWGQHAMGHRLKLQSRRPYKAEILGEL